MIGPTTRVFGLVGRPVAHSLSPAIHNALFAEHGIDAVYLAFDVAPEDGPLLADAIRTLGLAGVNLTVPHKAAILPFLVEQDRAVQASGAANVVINRDGRLVGFNTDGEGFCRAFEERFGPRLADRPAIVLGAGGAGRAVAAGIASRGCPEILLLNRTPARAERAIASLGRWFPGVRWSAGPLDAEAFAAGAATAGLVVHAGSGPAAPLVDALPVERLPIDSRWCDLNYWMADPPALEACERRGIAFQRGLDMLVHQGALAFERFTGQPADPDHIRRNLG